MINKIPSFVFTPAEYLARASGATDLRDGLPVEGAASFYAGYLALCHSQPQLVHETFTSRHRIYSHELSQIQVVAGLAPHFSRGRQLSEVPTTLEELQAISPQDPNDVNGEWVCAVLMACGVDPWDIPHYSSVRDCGHGAHHHPVPKFAAHGWSGVLRNAIKHSSAPDIEQIAQMEVGGWNGVSSMRAFALSQEDTSVLRVLVECGMQLASDDKVLVDELGKAHPSAIEYLAQEGILAEIPEKLRKRIENGFAARVKKNALNKESMAEMSRFLMGKASSAGDAAQTAELDGLLSVPWCDTSYRSSTDRNFGIKKLNEVGTSKNQLKGGWSFLGAYMMSCVRKATKNGSPHINLGELVKCEYVVDHWESADLFSRQYQGSLAPAVNVQWRDGISMAAPMLMYLLTIDTRGLVDGPEGSERMIKEFCSATGIENFTQFVSDHGNEVALFTTAITRSNSPVQHKLLGRIWNVALGSEYGATLNGAVSDENKVNVLLSLTGNFNSSKSWDKSGNVFKSEEILAFNSINGKFFPSMKGYRNLAGQFRDLSKRGLSDSPQAHAVLISALVGEQEFSEVLAEVKNSVPPKSKCADILKMWMTAHKKDRAFVDKVAEVKAVLLSNVASNSSVQHVAASQRVKM